MGLKNALTYAVAIYLLLSSSLIVHELSHIFAAQFITNGCVFTGSYMRFDMLLYRRSGATSFACGRGVETFNPPQVKVIWDDFTLPTLVVMAAQPAGSQTINNPLSAGWFNALMGPAMEIAYVAILTDWLGRTFRGLRGLKAAFLPVLLIIFGSSAGDFTAAVPASAPWLFSAAYVLAFAVIALGHVSLNMDYYKMIIHGPDGRQEAAK